MTIKVTHFRIKVPLTTMIAVMTTFIVVKEAVFGSKNVEKFLIPSYYNKPDVDDICALTWGLHHMLSFFPHCKDLELLTRKITYSFH